MDAINWPKIVDRSTIPIVILCLLAFGVGILCQILGPQNPHVGRTVCLPLGIPEDVVADEKGRIYVVLTFYQRVQVYDPDGTFLFGFFTQTQGGSARLRIDADGRLNVVTTRGKRVHVYDESGNLLSSKEAADNQLYRQLARDHVRGTGDVHGNRYVIREPLWNPQIVRYDNQGSATLRIATPAVLWMLIGPFPCWLVGVAVGGGVTLVRYWKANHRQVASGEELFPGGRIRRRYVLLRFYLPYRPYRSKFDVILTDRAVCWAPTVWDPYLCIAYPDLQFRVERCGLLKLKRRLHLQSRRDPALSIRFTPIHFDKWVAQLKSLTQPSGDDSGATKSTAPKKKLRSFRLEF
jgi:hypothetical protein